MPFPPHYFLLHYFILCFYFMVMAFQAKYTSTKRLKLVNVFFMLILSQKYISLVFFLMHFYIVLDKTKHKKLCISTLYNLSYSHCKHL